MKKKKTASEEKSELLLHKMDREMVREKYIKDRGNVKSKPCFYNLYATDSTI